MLNQFNKYQFVEQNSVECWCDFGANLVQHITGRFHDIQKLCNARYFTLFTISNSVDIKAVSARLGHCNIRITADTYGHIFDAYQARIAQSVEDKLL